MAREGVTAIVIGGGVGGLAAAIALRQAGRDVVVCERADELAPAGAGLSLWPNALRALDALGVGDAVRALGAPEQGGGIRTWRGGMLAPLSTADLAARYGVGAVAVHRADLQRALLDALPSGTVRLGAPCVGVGQDSAGATVRLADGSSLRGALVVGADGLHSMARAALFGAAAPRYAGYTAWRAVAAFPLGRVRPGESWGRGARFGQVVLSGGRVYWFAAANAPEGAGDAPEGRKAELLRRFRDWHNPIPALIAATGEGAILRNDIYDRPPLRRWSVGRVTLLGDAAHPMTPDLGQGGCQALEDAVALGRCLRAQDDVVAALRRYEALRLPRTRMIARQARLLGWIAQWESAPGYLLRDILLRAAPPRAMGRGLAPIVGYDIRDI